jgi:hypothetical protein
VLYGRNFAAKIVEEESKYISVENKAGFQSVLSKDIISEVFMGKIKSPSLAELKKTTLIIKYHTTTRSICQYRRGTHYW